MRNRITRDGVQSHRYKSLDNSIPAKVKPKSEESGESVKSHCQRVTWSDLNTRKNTRNKGRWPIRYL